MWKILLRMWGELQFRFAAHAPTKYQSNSTSGRGARASYRTMLPEISARRSLLWAKLQIPVSRHWGREMSAPRPYVTDPFRPLSLINSWKQFLYIQQHSSYFLNVVRSSVSGGGEYLAIAHALLQKHSYLWFRAMIRHDTHSCIPAQNTWHPRMCINSSLFRFEIFLGGSCHDIVRLSI